jgi:uncharacterized repeat protein (TIGR01451 family)
VGNAVTATLNLTVGGRITLTVTGGLNASATGVVTNTVAINTPAGLTNTNPITTATDTTTLTPQADLSVSKSATPNPALAGAAITYTVIVTNAGPSTVSFITVTDALPAQIMSPSYTASSGTYNSTSGLWTGLTLATGQRLTLTIAGTVDASFNSTLTNVVRAATPVTVTELVAANNVYTQVMTTTQRADLSLSKVVNTVIVTMGQNVTFTLVITNGGPSDATGVTVSDTLPSGLIFSNATASVGSYDNSTGLWTIGNVTHSTTATLSLIATVNTISTVTNIAQVATSNQPDPDSTPGNSNASEDDQASALVGGQVADLSIAKTVAPNLVAVGTRLTYTLSITNNGPAPATNVVVTDTLPTSATLATAASCTANSGIVVCNLGSLANGATVSQTIVVTATSAGTFTNTAIVRGAEIDQNSANNIAIISATAATVSLLVTQSAVAPAGSIVHTGDTLTYALRLTNTSIVAATNVVVTDVIPSLTIFVTGSVQPTPSNTNPLVWSMGVLGAGQMFTATFQVMVQSITTTATLTNTATVKGSELATTVSSAPLTHNAQGYSVYLPLVIR